jgi:uncharacterized protein YeaO (DUF488 family)
MKMIRVRRVYDAIGFKNGPQYLVDRIWPRGVRKEALHLTEWRRDVAPSDELRRWFGHDPAQWGEFRRRYYEELDDKRQAWLPLLEAARQGEITLLYSARDTEHNNAVALKAYLEQRLTTI